MPVVSLIPHPATRPHRDVSVQLSIGSDGAGGYDLSYRLAGLAHVRLDGRGVGRTDELWRHTCFELFVKARSASAYREFNFAPTSAWAVYDFDDWRSGMRSPSLRTEPRVRDGRLSGRPLAAGEYAMHIGLDRGLVPDGPLMAAPTAVLEGLDGSKSYWALAHPPGEPNFHHPACFAFDLSPPHAA